MSHSSFTGGKVSNIPSKKMKVFILRLGKLTKNRKVCNKATFRTAVREALERTAMMPIGTTNLFLTTVSDRCEVSTSAFSLWARGSDIPNNGLRKTVLQEMHSHLSLRYA